MLLGNVCNRLLHLNAAIVRGLTCCKILARHWASRKIRSTKFPLGGEVNHIQPVAYSDQVLEITYNETLITLLPIDKGNLITKTIRSRLPVIKISAFSNCVDYREQFLATRNLCNAKFSRLMLTAEEIFMQFALFRQFQSTIDFIPYGTQNGQNA